MQCSRCTYLAQTSEQLEVHQRQHDMTTGVTRALRLRETIGLPNEGEVVYHIPSGTYRTRIDGVVHDLVV